MKILFLLLCCSTAFGQQINTSQIKDGAVTEPKLNANALRPINSGALSGTALTFDKAFKKYTLAVTSDKALTFASGVADSRIIITATGDGSHVVTFPSTWIVSGAYNPNLIQKIDLYYDGTYVFVTMAAVVDIIEVDLTDAVVASGTPTQLQLTFDNSVNITTDGWTLTSDGGTVQLVGVSGSGTSTPIFTLARIIEGGETATLSYSTITGSTTSLTGNEIETITNQSVTTPPAVPPSGFDPDITVDDSGGQDFTTITAATTAATAGQVIGIKAGTYRETIVGKTGVTYQNFPGEDVYVSGFEVIPNTGWTVHSGNIYKKTITLPVNGYNTSTSLISESVLNTTIFANQILRDGIMMIEARYPNIDANGTYGTDDYLLRSKYRNGIDYTNGFNTNNLTDASFPVVAPGLIGATLVGNGWISQETRTITGHSGNVVSWAQAIWDNGATGKWNRKIFYITNDLQLLDEAYEWHYESGTLYFWQPGGGTISGTVVYKARNWGFDLRDKQNVSIIGLKFIGCEAAHGNTNTSGVTLDGITSTFASHHVRHDVVLWQGVGMSRQFGIKLKGMNNTVKNSDIGYSGSQGIWIGGGGLVENNYIHDLGYVGYWANGCSPWDNIETGGLKFIRNTTANTGRSGFDFGYNFHYGDQASAPVRSRKYGFEIAYNDMSGWGSMCQDVGATYAWGQNDMGPTGVDYHHNWIHDSHAPDRSDVGLNVGIYFDQSTGPGRIHHNVVWGAGAADMYHETHNSTRPFGANTTWLRPYPTMDIYNNTFFNKSGFGVDNSPSFTRSYITYEGAPLDRQRNNIYGSVRVHDFGSDVANSISTGTNPQFLFGDGTSSDIADINTHSGLYFQLASGSPARGIGVNNYAGVMGTITDAGTDAGAYMYGATPWTAGRSAVVVSDIVNDTDATITYSAGWTYANSQYQAHFNSGDMHYTSATGSTAEYVFTSTSIAVYMEKCDNAGTVRIQIFDDTSVNGTFTDQIGSNTDVNLYQSTGTVGDEASAGNPCPNGQRTQVFTVSGLTAGDKMIKITHQAVDNTTVPARNTVVFDNYDLAP